MLFKTSSSEALKNTFTAILIHFHESEQLILAILFILCYTIYLPVPILGKDEVPSSNLGISSMNVYQKW